MAGVKGNVICLFSTKGGVGRTTLAANLAVSFAAQGHRAALVDFDLQSGACDFVLGVTPEKTIADLVGNADFHNVSDYLTSLSDNLSILPSPARPDITLRLESGDAKAILVALRADFDFVVVDTPSVLADHVSGVLEAADFIGLVAGNDSLSIKNAVFAMQNLALLGYDLQIVRLILNQFDSHGPRVEEVEEAVGLPVFWRIDRDNRVLEALSEAQPVVLNRPRARASVAIRRLALALAIEFGRVRGR